jgi:RNA polymerase sigma factor (sigma-70 family)
MANRQVTVILRHLRELATPADSNKASDRELLGRFVTQRDEAAFAALVRRHGPMVLRVCQRVLHHRQDAEDACQATFLVLARKATSSGWHDSVANWLYEVAYHLARKASTAAARRSAHEGKARLRAAADPLTDITWRELQTVLDEELARLPAKYRAPLILCCLEGRARDEAAQQLGWTLPVVKSRLEHGRELLRARLTRRGLTLGAALAGPTLGQSTAPALPPPLVSSTTKAAVLLASGKTAAGVLSARVTALVEGMSKTICPTKVQLAALFLLVVGIVGAGAGALARREVPAPTAQPQQEAPKPPAKAPLAAKEDTDKPAREPALEEQGDRVTVRGRVLDPDGKPFVGAEISIWWHYGYWIAWHPQTVTPPRPRVLGTSGPDGRFCFSFAKAEIDDTPTSALEKPWRHCQITAAAKGYGPGWKHSFNLHKEDLTLRLARDDIPIKGRVCDLQGRPVAGATVRPDYLSAGEDHLWQNAWAGLPENVTTDKDGTFVLTGIGRDRTIHLHVEGPMIEHKLVSVTTPPLGDGKKMDHAAVEVLAGPTKPIVGTVRARDTGKPLAGVVVYGEEEPHRGGIRAVTDEEGRYRLVGLPKARSYRLTAYPKAGQRYLETPWLTPVQVADSEGLKPITADLELWRGVTVRFRLLDEETGQPVRRSVQYTPLPDNPYKAKMRDPFIPSRAFYRTHSPDRNGYFQFVAYPGPGVLFCLAGTDSTPYVQARPSPADEEKWFAAGKPAASLVGFINMSQGYCLLDVADTSDTLTFDVRLSRGGTLTGTLLGPDGKPVTGALAYGLTFDASALHPSVPVTEEVLPTESFTVRGLYSKPRVGGFEPRTLTFVHKERKLIGYVVVHGNDQGPLTVRLQPWGALTGRLVDTGGKPLAKVRVKSWHGQPRPGVWPPDAAGGEVETDRDGRFRLEYLVPGLKRELLLGGGLSAGAKLKDLTVRAGEVKDLGDVTVKGTPEKKDQ